MTETDVESMGPIDYLIVEFPQQKITGEGFRLLLDLVDRGIVRILDFAFVVKGTDGSVRSITMEDLEWDEASGLGEFAGASSGLLGDEDVAEAGAIITPGHVAAMLVYENTWAAPLATAMRRNGGQFIASGRLPVQAVLAALDALDAEPA